MKKILYTIWIVLLLIGCSQPSEYKYKDQLEKADSYASQGHEYIQESIDLYKALLEEAPQVDLQEDVKLKLGSLYLDIGRYQEAIECFLGIKSQQAKKKLAIAYFKNLQQSDALAQFERLGELKDDEYLYYYGQALEENNLYDKALKIYSLIPQQAANYAKASARIESINLSDDILSTQKINEIINNSPGQDDYPEAGAIILLADESFEAFEDNTAEYNMHFMFKILNERGKRQFSEVEIGYDSTFEEVELEYARTIKPDGKVVYVGDKNIRDVSIYLNYPLYSNARAKIISMPEVAEGVIIEYRAKVFRKQLVNKKDFIVNYPCQAGEPIKTAKFTVKIPKGRELNYKLINTQYNTFVAKLEPEITTDGNKKVFSWNMENIPEILPESDMPPQSRVNPIIMMSTFKQWDDVYRWWYELYKDKIDIDKDIQQKIDELIRDKETQEDKIRAIYNFCAQDIRYVAVEYGQAGYEPHEAKDIFKNKYGDCKDQSILLIAMLRTIGVKAYPVLIGTYDHINLQEDFPSITFNHCIAVVDASTSLSIPSTPLGMIRGMVSESNHNPEQATNSKSGRVEGVDFQDELIFMDPTGQTVSFRDLPSMDDDRLIFLILDDEYKIVSTPASKAQNNLSNRKMQIKIEEDGSIYAKRRVDTNGAFEQSQRYWLQFTKPQLIKEVLEGTANGIAPGARLVDYKIENEKDLDKEVVLEYEFQAPEFLTKADKSRLLPQFGGIGMSSIAKKERVYPIELPILFENTSTIEIVLPENLSLKYLPQDIRVDVEWFEFENTYKMEDRTITFYEKYGLKKKVVTQEEYKEYKDLVENIARQINQRIILEEK
ncbi:DUF3857 domain-containing protein [Candidatus Omnitrophota bacterium]